MKLTITYLQFWDTSKGLWQLRNASAIQHQVAQVWELEFQLHGDESS